MEEADGGTTHVYLPKEYSKIVLKHSGSPTAQRRLLQMRKARVILEAQKAQNVVIPRATLCGEKKFLAEDRVKINIDREHNQKLYLSKPSLFDNAVREMVRLFTKARIEGIFLNEYTYHNNVTIVEKQARYDNFPLIILKNKEGGIALIDLENIRFSPGNATDLASLFPCHREIILEEGKKWNLDCEGLTSGRDYQLDHFRWLHYNSSNKNRFEELQSVLEAQGCRYIEGPLTLLKAGNEAIVQNLLGQQSLYLSEPRLFDNAVREMTRLFSQVTLSGLTKNSRVYSDRLSHIDRITPSVSFYTKNEGKEGVIALIDIGEVTFSPTKDPVDELIHLFPNHREMILDVSTDDIYLGDFCWFTKLKDSFPGISRREGYIKRNESDPDKLFHLSETRKKEIYKRIADCLISYHFKTGDRERLDRYLSKGCYNWSGTEKYLQELAAAEKLAPKLCDLFFDSLKSNLTTQRFGTVESLRLKLERLGLDQQVYRSVEIKRAALIEPYKNFIETDPIMRKMGWAHERNIAWDFAMEFLPGATDGKEIFYLEVNLYYQRHDPGAVCYVYY